MNSIGIRCFFFILILSGTLYGRDLKSFMNGNIELFYEESGEGPAIYILTGGPGVHPETPGYQIMDSLENHYTCILLHQRGSGKSANIPINKQTINIAAYLQDIELLRQIRNDNEIILMGMSWGGLLAMNYAVLYPQHVKDMVLICSAPPSFKLWNVLYDNQYTRRSQSELDSMELLLNIFSTKTGAELHAMKKSDPMTPEILAFKKFINIHMRAMYYNRNMVSIGFDELFYNFNFQPIPLIDNEIIESSWDITPELKKLDIPALILYGRQDDQGESTFYLQKESLKNSVMQVIERCGHNMPIDCPDEFYAALKNYLVK